MTFIIRGFHMIYENMTYQKDGHVMVINLPEISNYHERITAMADELADLCETIKWDEGIRTVVINWKYPGPSSQTDWNLEILSQGEPDTAVRSLAAAIAHLDMPVICCINGEAIGQALELALACDIRFAAEISKFGMPQIASGKIPMCGGTQRLSRLVGSSKALELILTGEIIDTPEAHTIGLINQVLKAKDPMPEVIELAYKISAKGPIAVRYAKEAVHKGMDLTLDQGLRLEADLYYLLHTTRDRTEGVRAFQEKRNPEFKGQ
jgi:enoyl-CoA hydratase/carnithine racemase